MMIALNLPKGREDACLVPESNTVRNFEDADNLFPTFSHNYTISLPYSQNSSLAKIMSLLLQY